jgi:hypothetical protein
MMTTTMVMVEVQEEAAMMMATIIRHQIVMTATQQQLTSMMQKPIVVHMNKFLDMKTLIWIVLLQMEETVMTQTLMSIPMQRRYLVTR